MANGRIRRPDAEKNRLPYPQVGQVKIGYKTDKGYPTSVDYFIPQGKYARLFQKAFGEKPSTIQIVFPDDNPQKVCNERYEYRDDNGRLIASGDGENYRVWDGEKYIDMDINKYPNLMKSIATRYPNRNVKNGGDGWRIVLELNFMIPLVRGVAGVWKFTTKGNASTIPQIRDVFDEILEKRGFVRGIIFDLSVKFATTQKPGESRRFPVVSLTPNESENNVDKVKEAFKPISK